MNLHYDVIIIGGGLAGLSLTRQLLLANNNLKIAVLEFRKHPVAEAIHKVGESLVEIGAHYFNNRLQLGEHLKTDQLKKAGLRFFFTHQNNEDISQRIEFGATFFPKTPSFQLDRGRFENYLAQLITEQGAHFIDEAKVLAIDLNQNSHTVSYSHQGEKQMLFSRWVIDASGRSGKLKRQLELTKAVEHDINTAWFRIKGKLDLDTWSSQADWLKVAPRDFRYLSTNHLMGKGYWTWLIPLASNCTSIGIVADAALHPFNEINHLPNALEWLKKYEPQLATKLATDQYEIIDFHSLKHYSHDCEQVFSAQRWALTGEAGVFLDPFYSPGSDFIALSNEFISDLIINDLAGFDIKLKAAYYNKQYLELFQNFLLVYQNQYLLMGYPGTMIHKVIWDYAVYWGIISLLYFNKKITDINFMQTFSSAMHKLVVLNKKVQTNFHNYINDPHAFPVKHFTDTMSYQFLQDWNTNLMQSYDDSALFQLLNNNLAYLQLIAEQYYQGKSLIPSELELETL
ncbi:MAG: hypothetical protein A3E87_01370 [Gammaproteobacteria bacterium RIFCSPHIGHO2_12_FULL_35_23]|nr:MAG: hypothetical protein A3E87_01370 [Gammaproteobacteria bacterium RIFCSPHIGHO2_12_FULL_35_23]